MKYVLIMKYLQKKLGKIRITYHYLPKNVRIYSTLYEACVVLTLMLSRLMFGHTGSTGKELEAHITLDQGLELLSVVSKHIRVVGPVMVPQT